ncbi:MAG: hypothetical protein BMS9Abin11_1790 [Gammaproteobacteria bacterium]|nr:MAG: hypothetical protein BMS9Abin11_1790 [Gammaproteobacteria bacterium]
MQQQQMDIKPAYEVEVLEGTVDKEVTRMIEGKLETEIIQVPKGYMVYFPSGHSIGVATYKDLEDLGLSEAPNLVDMESGDTISKPSQHSLKSEVARKTKPTRKKQED